MMMMVQIQNWQTFCSQGEDAEDDWRGIGRSCMSFHDQNLLFNDA